MITLCIIAIGLFIVLKKQAWNRCFENTVELLPGISLRLLDVESPPKILECVDAINTVLNEFRPNWNKKLAIIIEWSPYGKPITGPYIKTGFVTRKDTRAVLPPVPPYKEGLENDISIVGGTCKFTKKWPWTKYTCATVTIMDGRSGATRRQRLLGEGKELPVANADATAIFYEICWRAVPVVLDGLKLVQIPSGTPSKEYQDAEIKMKQLARRR